MKRLLQTLVIAAMLLISHAAFSAYLRNVPQTLNQPDNTVLQCFASGDEFHNWLHDANDFTIIRHPQTGFYVYAALVNDVVTATNYIAGQVNPASVGLAPGVNISGAEWLAKRNAFFAATPEKSGVVSGGSKNTGNLNNLVVYIRFSGETEFTDLNSVYTNMFNNTTAGYNSMNNYFKEVSYNSLFVNSTFYPIAPSSTVLSYQDIYNRNYYRPYNATTNPTGYNGSTERRLREHTLLKNAINAVKASIPTTLNIDYDNDGYVDNICFIVKGAVDGWNDLLWPHRWSLFSETVLINGKEVWDYNFNLQNSVLTDGNGVLCHEMFHTLGAPDLYHYTSNGISPVGQWDLMGSDQNPPQHMGAYMKQKYGGWINTIPWITTSGTYTLNPQTASSNNAFRIASPYSSTEFFVVEYRQKTGAFENSLPGSGLLVYRIDNQAGNGNANGPPDEVYLYRPNGTLTVNGTLTQAHFSSNTGRTAIHAGTNPTPFLSSGNAGGLNITNIGSAGSTITFTVNLNNPPVVNFTASATQTCIGNPVTFTDNTTQTPTSWAWSFTPPTVTYVSGTNANSQNPVVQFNSGGTYSVKLIATNASGSDSLTKTAYISVMSNFSLPVNQGFETVGFPPTGWNVVNPDNSTTWERTTAAGGNAGSLASAYINHFVYGTVGAVDDLVSNPISLSGFTSAFLTFKVAYRAYAASYSDGLRVHVSTDCGQTWGTALYDKTGNTLATGPYLTTSFSPSTAADWRTDSISLAAYAGQNIMIRFQTVCGYGNNLYLDDISVTGISQTVTYCLASGTNCGASDEYISQVQLGAINRVSICGNYQDFTTTDSTILHLGNTYTLTVTNPHHWSGDLVGCWIDWNRNGIFTDTLEYYALNYTGLGGGNGTGIGTGTVQITVPSTAALGKTRMRVRLVYGVSLQPCGTTTYGEVEDYSVVVAVPSPATIQLSPGTLSFSTANGTQQSLNLTVSNTGQAPLVVSGIQVPAGFSAAPLSFTVNGSSSQMVVVTFSPTAVQTYSGNLVVTSNAVSGGNVVSLTGQGTAPAQAVVGLSPSSLSFSAQTGTQQVKQVKVYNTGNAALNVSNVIVPIGYSSNPIVFSVNPGDSQTVSITFAPIAVQAYNGQLQVVSNAASGTTIIPITGQGTAIPVPLISVNPVALSFSANVGSSQIKTVYVKNPGTATLIVSGHQISTGFTAIPLSFTVNAGDSVAVTVTFSPTAVQTYSGQLSFTSNAASGANTVSLTGTGTAIPQGILTVSPTSLSFGNVTIGSTGSVSMLIGNTGNAALTVSAISCPVGFTVPFFSPFTLNPGTSQLVAVVFTPVAASVYSGSIVVQSSINSVAVSVNGTGVAPVSPVITLSTDTLYFNTIVGNTQIMSVTVGNSGQAVLSISGIQLPNGYSANPSSFMVNPASTQIVSISFSPTAAQIYAGNALFFSNATTGQSSLYLYGQAAAPSTPYLTANPGTLSFGSIPTAGSYSLNLTLSNAGSAPAIISNISVPQGFSITGSTSFTLAAGTSQIRQVVFSPTAVQTYSGNLVVSSNANPISVPLMGTGVQAQPAVIQITPASLSFAATIGTIDAQYVIVKNSGQSALNVSSVSTPSAFFVNPSVFSILPGDSQVVTISFAPIIVQNYNGVIYFNSNAGSGSPIVNVSGIASTGSNALSLSKDSLNYGNVILATVKQDSVVVTNTGATNVSITGLSLPQGYSTGFTTYTLSPGGTVSIVVTFNPTQLGLYSGIGTIQSSDGNKVINLTGTGVVNPGIAEDNDETTARVYPNPADEYINLDVTPAGEMLLRITDMWGRVVKEESGYVPCRISIDELSAGVYLIEGITSNGLPVFRLRFVRNTR